MKLTASPLDENLLQLGASPKLTKAAEGKAESTCDKKFVMEKGGETHTEKLKETVS